MEKQSIELIYKAARELFLAEGFERVSIRKIAARAKVNSALISYYFGGKEKLYQKVLENETSAIRGFLTPELKEKAPREILRGYAQAMASLHEAHPGLYRVLMRLNLAPEAVTSAFMQELMHSIYDTLYGALKRGVEAGEFRADLDLHAAVLQLVGIINFDYITRSARSQLLADKPQEAADSYAAQAVEIFLRGISHENEN